MKRRITKGLEILLALLLVLGLFVVGRQSSDYKKGRQDYDEAENLANLPTYSETAAPSSNAALTKPAAEDPYAVILKENISLSALKDVNQDVVGWIDIPGTELSYPVLQGEDNNYYLNHTWKGETNSVGSVFLECQADPELADFNTIIYGHRMRDLSMFGSLKYYENASYWEEHPCVYVVIDEDAYRYDIYAAYKADPEDITYGLKINSRPKKQELIQFGLEHSVIETGIEPTTYDRILTLSTCTASGHASRWVVQAVYRVEASEAPEDAGDAFEGADDALDASAQNTGDALVFPDASDTREQAGTESFGTILRAVLLTGAFLILAVLAAAAIVHILFRRQKNSD